MAKKLDYKKYSWVGSFKRPRMIRNFRNRGVLQIKNRMLNLFLEEFQSNLESVHQQSKTWINVLTLVPLSKPKS